MSLDSRKDRVFVSLSTIPSRANDPLFIRHIRWLTRQTVPPEKIFVILCRAYKRFPGQAVEERVASELGTIPRVEVCWADEDLGPATKFVFPLEHRYEEIKDGLLIVIDDDRFYHPRMIEIYLDALAAHPGAHVLGGNQEFYFQRRLYETLGGRPSVRASDSRYVAAFMSFLLNPAAADWRPLVAFTRTILREVPESFFHDEGILLNYLRFLDLRVLYVNFAFVPWVEEEMENALCTGSFVDRRACERRIEEWLNASRYLGVTHHHRPSRLSALLRRRLAL
ncbi:hypothetical protein EBZ80_05370 [bacterium]|nr:hypothetical protein [bacterium]